MGEGLELLEQRQAALAVVLAVVNGATPRVEFPQFGIEHLLLGGGGAGQREERGDDPKEKPGQAEG